LSKFDKLQLAQNALARTVTRSPASQLISNLTGSLSVISFKIATLTYVTTNLSV